MLVDTTAPGLNFKHFDDRGERVYSVRVDGAVRAHLRPVPGHAKGDSRHIESVATRRWGTDDGTTE